ncbi:hypothetical protein Hanom_Chr06g00479981 [Helianthus anomalus]
MLIQKVKHSQAIYFRAVNVQQTVRESFSRKFVCVHSFIKQTNTNKKFCSFS